MGFRRFLHEGEEIVLEVHPHWWYLAGPVATVVVVIAGAIAAAVESTPAWVGWVTLAALVLAVAWMLARYTRWRTTRLIVTTSRLVERQGVLSRRGREIPLLALTDISFHQTLFERIIGAGSVVIESAGRDARETFPDLPRPASIHNEIYRQVEIARKAASTAGTYSQGLSIPQQIDQLDQLRRRGVITDAEFEAKKSKLLDRL